MGLVDSLSALVWGPPAPPAWEMRGDGPIELTARQDSAPAEPTPGWLRNTYDSIINLLSGLGTTGDPGAAGEPNTMLPAQRLTPAKIEALWRDSALARRIVAIVPDDATKKGWHIEDESVDVSPLADEDERLQIIARVKEAWTWGRRDGGAHVLMVLDEDVPPRFRQNVQAWLAEPIDLARVRAVRNLVVLERWEASVAEWDDDPTSPHFRGVRVWNVHAQSSDVSLMGVRVHRSRLLYFGGAPLSPRERRSNGGYDDSILQSCWASLRNKLSIGKVGATAAQQLYFMVMKLGKYEGQAVGDQAALTAQKLRTFATGRSQLNVGIVDANDDVSIIGAPISGFAELHEAAKDDLAGDTAIPMVRLFGQAPGGLNTDGNSQHETWADVNEAHQEAHLREPLTRLYTVLYAAKQGPAKGAIPKKWRVVFEPLRQLSQKEKAEVRKLHAETDAIYIDAQVMTPDHVAASRFSDDGYSDEILAVDLADLEAAAEEQAAEAEAQLEVELARGQRGPVGQGGQREDAAEDSAALLVPLPDDALVAWREARAAAEKIVGAMSTEDEPHVTVLFLGRGDFDLQMIQALTVDALERVTTHPVAFARVEVFPTRDGRTPIVLGLDWGPFRALNDALLRALAPHVTAAQFPEFRAHATLGYVERALTEGEKADLVELKPGTDSWLPSRVQLRYGGGLVATWALRADAEEEAEAAK